MKETKYATKKKYMSTYKWIMLIWNFIMWHAKIILLAMFILACCMFYKLLGQT